MKKLRTLDLFSGCGGMALGLRSFTDIVAYCEKDADCVAVLKKNMQRGRLDEAPVVRDVCEFPSDLQDIDCICASPPCQSVSTFGLKEGLQGETGLFLPTIAIINHYKPAICFFENVDNIRHMTTVWQTVLKLLNDAGYNCQWAVVSASNAGALHRRGRWFLLAKLRSDEPFVLPYSTVNLQLNKPWNHKGYLFHKNSSEPCMPRLVKKGNTAIMKMCGNICVPLQARMAFSLLSNSSVFTITEPITSTDKMPQCGAFVNGHLYMAKHAQLLTPRTLQLVFNQKYYNSPKHKHFRQRHPVLSNDATYKLFSTPRVCNASWTPSNVLTQRSIRDLATQLRFERKTKKHERLYRCINPDWLSWVSGLPKGYLIGQGVPI